MVRAGRIRGVRAVRRAALACVAVGAVASAPLDPSVVRDADMTLGISNGTTLEVTIVVDGVIVQTRGAGQGDEAIPASRLPPLPWHVRVETSGGRMLLGLIVHGGDVHHSANRQSGDSARVDLSCGRLDLWSGPPISGPAPGPGVPGDCAP